jgi:c-di-GMP-binding flagellar brake protein YcgR
MASLQELDIRQIAQVIAEGVERNVPVAVTVQEGGHWQMYHSRLVAERSDRILLEIPHAEDGTPQEFAPASKIALSFKLRHHKYVYVATVAGCEHHHLGEDDWMQVLGICWPTKMQRIQRRAYYRAEVPEGYVVRAAVWLGGRGDEPAGGSGREVFTGRLSDLSAGGVKFLSEDSPPWPLENGTAVGLRLSFEAGTERLYLDGMIRHVICNEPGTQLGIQFVALEQSPEGRRSMRFISGKVSEYQRINLQQMAPADEKSA